MSRAKGLRRRHDQALNETEHGHQNYGGHHHRSNSISLGRRDGGKCRADSCCQKDGDAPHRVSHDMLDWCDSESIKQDMEM